MSTQVCLVFRRHTTFSLFLNNRNLKFPFWHKICWLPSSRHFPLFTLSAVCVCVLCVSVCHGTFGLTYSLCSLLSRVSSVDRKRTFSWFITETTTGLFSCYWMMLSVRHLTLKLRSQSLNEESNFNNIDKVISFDFKVECVSVCTGFVRRTGGVVRLWKKKGRPQDGGGERAAPCV